MSHSAKLSLNVGQTYTFQDLAQQVWYQYMGSVIIVHTKFMVEDGQDSSFELLEDNDDTTAKIRELTKGINPECDVSFDFNHRIIHWTDGCGWYHIFGLNEELSRELVEATRLDTDSESD